MSHIFLMSDAPRRPPFGLHAHHYWPFDDTTLSRPTPLPHCHDSEDY